MEITSELTRLTTTVGSKIKKIEIAMINTLQLAARKNVPNSNVITMVIVIIIVDY
jgi:hypothetical protein